MVDVEKMSDAELRAELSARGENVGPVTGTTRSLYEKKLKKLIAGGGKTPGPKPAAPKPVAATPKPVAVAPKPVTVAKPTPKVTVPAKPPVVVKKAADKTPDTTRRSIPRAAAAAANSSINSTFNRSEVEDMSDSDEPEEEEEEEIVSPRRGRPPTSSLNPYSSTPTKKLSPIIPKASPVVQKPKHTPASTSRISTTVNTTTRIPTTPRSIHQPVHVPNLITDFTPSFATFGTDRPGATPPRNRLNAGASSMLPVRVLEELGNTTGDEDDYEGTESSRIVYKSKEPSSGIVKNAWNKVLGYGFNASKHPGDSYDLRAGSSRVRVQKNPKTGKVTVKQSNVFNDAMLVALYGIIIIIVVLAFAYILTSGSVEKQNLLGWWAILKAAGRDFLNFFYNYAILPVVSIGLLVVLGAGIYFGHRKYKETKEEEEAKLYDLIEKITDLVLQSSEDGDPYLSQPHVRDLLFPPSKRRSAELARWEQAVKFIDTNESRVATDILVLPSGNECAVWKWIGNQSQKKRVW